MHRTVALALCVPLAACNWFDDAKNTLENLANPLVAEGILLGVEAPVDDTIDLSDTEYAEGTVMTLFLADTADSGGLTEAPVTGAVISLRGDAIGSIPIDDAGGGRYSLDAGAATYESGAVWTINVTLDGELTTAALTLPPPANVDVPTERVRGQDLTLDLLGMGYESALVVVAGDSGSITYTNEPATIGDIYNMTHGSAELESVTIPDSAFPENSGYLVGVAGMKHTTASDLDGMNTALSSIMMGNMEFYPIATTGQ
jgi:hypothetical protein